MCPPFSLLGSSLAFSLASRIGFQGSPRATSNSAQFAGYPTTWKTIPLVAATHTNTQHLQRERERESHSCLSGVNVFIPVARYESCRWLEWGRGWILPWYVTGRCNQEQFTNSARCIGTDLLPSRNLVISIVSMNNVVQSSPAIPPLSMPRFFVPRGRARIDLSSSLECDEKIWSRVRSKVLFIRNERREILRNYLEIKRGGALESLERCPVQSIEEIWKEWKRATHGWSIH